MLIVLFFSKSWPVFISLVFWIIVINTRVKSNILWLFSHLFCEHFFVFLMFIFPFLRIVLFGVVSLACNSQAISSALEDCITSDFLEYLRKGIRGSIYSVCLMVSELLRFGLEARQKHLVLEKY